MAKLSIWEFGHCNTYLHLVSHLPGAVGNPTKSTVMLLGLAADVFGAAQQR